MWWPIMHGQYHVVPWDGDGINVLVKPMLLKTKWISTGNHFVEEDFYPDDL
jgi:hypothetical protein